ncbi:MAG: zonular occludens toxin domain-containing protein [Campylobacterota bacterium]|nr:zonular occludens toxin domain-containing protein [Campylobacterota bacterium]
MSKIRSGPKRSGKSYGAVYYIKHNRGKYHNVYTDINGINLDELDAKPYSHKKFYEVYKRCRELYLESKEDIDENAKTITIDDHILEYLLNEDIIAINPHYDQYLIDLEKYESLSAMDKFKAKDPKRVDKYMYSLFMIDEAYTYFDMTQRVDSVLLFMMAYSGHLYFDFQLLTQDPGDFHKAYLNRCTHFIHALPAERQPNPNVLKYIEHSKFPYKEGSVSWSTRFNSFTYPKKKEIFALYQSGARPTSGSFLTKYIIYFGLVIVGILIGLYFIYSGYKDKLGDTPVETKTISDLKPIQAITTNTSTKQQPTINNTYAKKYYITIDCIKDQCYNKKNEIVLQKEDLEDLLKNTDSKQLNSKKINRFQNSLTLLVTKDFLNLFKRGENESGFFKAIGG